MRLEEFGHRDVLVLSHARRVEQEGERDLRQIRERGIGQERCEPLRAEVVTRREVRLPAGPEHAKQRRRRLVRRLKDLARVLAQEAAILVEVRGPQPAELARLLIDNDTVAGPREQ